MTGVLPSTFSHHPLTNGTWVKGLGPPPRTLETGVPGGPVLLLPSFSASSHNIRGGVTAHRDHPFQGEPLVLPRFGATRSEANPPYHDAQQASLLGTCLPLEWFSSCLVLD